MESYTAVIPAIEELESVSDDAEPQAWRRAFEAGDFERALSELDEVLAAEPKNTLARLTWIRAHLEARQLPPTALCAPLEEVGETLSSPLLQRIAKALYLRASYILAHSNQSRLAWTMAERALEIEVDNFSSDARILDFALELLDGEIERAEQKREPASYKEALVEKREQLRRSHKAAKKSSPQIATVGATLTAKDIAENAPSSIPIPQLDFVKERPRRGLHIVPAFCAGAIVASLFFVQEYFFSTRSEQTPRPVIELALAAQPRLLPPKLEIAANKPLDKKLESVGRRLESLGNSQEAESTTAEKDEVDHAALDPSLAEGLPTPVSPRSDELESIDGSRDEETVPAFDSSTIAPSIAASVESIDEDSGRKMPIPNAALGNDLSVDSDGRVVSKSQPLDSRRGPGRGVALDGSPLRAYEVEQFSPPLLFRTLAPTRVLSAPSILSTTLAELPENTPIHVSARMGRWLELRSTGGRVGYIFSQDASESK